MMRKKLKDKRERPARLDEKAHKSTHLENKEEDLKSQKEGQKERQKQGEPVVHFLVFSYI